MSSRQPSQNRSECDYYHIWSMYLVRSSIEIEALKAEFSEAMEQSKWMKEKLIEMDSQMLEARDTIKAADRILHMKQTSTRSEVFRLKGNHCHFCHFLAS